MFAAEPAPASSKKFLVDRNQISAQGVQGLIQIENPINDKNSFAVMFSSKSSNTTTKRRRRDSNGSPENASDAECSSGTFEFDMEIVRDSESTSRRRGNKRSLQASNSDSCADPSIEMNTPSHGGPVHVEQCANPAEEHRPLIPIPETDADVSDDSFRTMADTMFSNGSGQVLTNRTIVFSLLIGTVGFVCSTLFLGMGISNAVNDSEVLFTIQADEITQDFERTFKQYITAARWVHHACSNVDMTRAQFRELYDYITLDLELEVRDITIFQKLHCVKYRLCTN